MRRQKRCTVINGGTIPVKNGFRQNDHLLGKMSRVSTHDVGIISLSPPAPPPPYYSIRRLRKKRFPGGIYYYYSCKIPDDYLRLLSGHYVQVVGGVMGVFWREEEEYFREHTVK